MKAWLAVLAVVGSLFALPVVVAHSCAGGGADCVCPVPEDGATHSHAGPQGSCAGGPGGSASAGPDGASVTPGLGAVAAALAVGLVALLVARRA